MAPIDKALKGNGKKFTNGKKVKYSFNYPSFNTKFGNFTACKIRLEEAAINNLILRVNVAGSVNGINKKNNSIQKKTYSKNSSQDLLTTPVPRKRGRPPKSIIRESKENIGTVVKKLLPQQIVQNYNNQKQTPEQKSKKQAIISKMIDQIEKPKEVTKYQYVLKYPAPLMDKNKRPPSKLSLDFAELPAVLRSVKLPGPTWKIKIFMKDIMTMSISVTNNQTPERSIVFTAKNQDYQIIVDGELIVLLGCPPTLRVAKDFEALVNIVNSISLTDCMVLRLKKVSELSHSKEVKN